MPTLPDKAAYIWGWYQALDGEHSAVNVKAYFDLQQIQPKAWEFEALQTLIRISKMQEPKRPA